MVDFRYHIVSIVAVFLALGIGIVLGSTALPRPVIDDLNRNVRRLTGEKQERADRIEELEEELADDGRFADAVAPLVIGGRLAGRAVVVVSAPGVGKDMRDGITSALQVARATVTGRVRLTERLADPGRAAELDDLVATLLPPGVQLSGATPVERAAAELAAVLAVRGRGSVPATPPAATTRVLAGLAENDFLTVDGETTQVVPAPLVLVLVPAEQARRTPSPAPDPAAPDPVLAFVDAAVERAQGVVVVGPTVDGGADPLQRLRADSALADRLSSVDGADTTPGRVAAVLALAGAYAGERGHYGTASGADGPIPSPARAPAP